MKIELVPQQLTAQVFPLVAKFFERTIPYSGGDYSLEQIRMAVNQGGWSLVVASDETGIVGAMTLAFMNYPNDRIAFVTSTGGTNICTKDSLMQLKNIVRAMGATKLQAGGRDSVTRMLASFGFKKRYTVVETTI